VKNVQVIDGAENCSFSICLVDDEDFASMFPAPGQDIEFIEDLVERVGEDRAGELVRRATTRRIRKRDAMGIDGTLFFGLSERRQYFPNKREDDVDKQLFESRSPKR
jgi:hypothetical protein